MDKAKLHKLLIGGLATVLCAITFWYVFIYNGIHYSDEDIVYPEVSEYQIFELTEGKKLSIPFTTKGNYIQRISVLLINLNPEETGDFHITISSENGEIVSEVNEPLSSIVAGEFSPIAIRERVKANSLYFVELSQSGASLTPYLLYCDENQVANGVEQLVCVHYMKEASTWEKIGIMAVVLIGLILAVMILIGVDLTNFAGTLVVKCALGLMLLVQFILMMPSFVYRFNYVNLDQSWRYALNVLTHKGYRIGDDAFFTYGPIGFICYLMNLDDNGITFYFGMTILILVVLANGFLLFKIWKMVTKQRISLISAIFATLVYVFAYTRPEWDNYMLYTLVLGVTISFYERDDGTEEGRRMGLNRLSTIIIINFLFVVMSLSKFSTFTSALAFVILFTVFDFFFNRRLEGLSYFLPACGFSVIAYLIYNPSVEDLFRYLKGIFKISDGWMISSQWDRCLDDRETVCLIIIMALYVVLIVGAILYNYKSSHIIISLSASMFLLYKYATTRHGLACGLWLFAMLYSVAVLSVDFRLINDRDGEVQNLPRKQVVGAVLALCFVVTGAIQINCLHQSTGDVVSEISEKIADIGRLDEPSATEQAIANGALPEELLSKVGDESVCVYSYRQALGATIPSLNLKIYPSIQGVLTIVPMMEQRNTYFFNSEDAPTYVIVYDETIDDRIDFLDSPYTWDGLKSNYQVDSVYEGITLLKKVRTDVPKDDITKEYTVLNSQVYNLNDVIEVPSDAKYATVKLSFNLQGKLKKFFYHVYITNLTAYYEDGRTLTGRAIIPTLEEGFETIYFPQNPGEMVESFGYVGESASDNIPRMVSFSFSGLGLKDLSDDVEVTWYR